MVSRVDQIYRSILLSKFFVRGWGKPENLRRIFAFRKILSNREKCQHLVDKNHPVTVTKVRVKSFFNLRNFFIHLFHYRGISVMPEEGILFVCIYLYMYTHQFI